MPRTQLVAISVLTAGTLIACSGTPPVKSVRDIPPAEISSSAPVVLGGPAGYEFVRVSTGLMTAGGVIIADAGAQSLVFFDSTGAFVRTAGRAGEGPGEFRALSGIWAHANTILAYDRDLRRLSRFTLSGEYISAEIVTAPDDAPSASPVGVFDDGCLLLMETSRSGPPAALGVQGDTVRLFEQCGSVSTPLPAPPTVLVETYIDAPGKGRYTYMTMPFARGGGVKVVGERIAMFSALSTDLVFIDRQGVKRDTVQVTRGVTRRAVTPEQIAAVRELDVGDSPEPDPLFDRVPLPDSLPYFGWGPMPRPVLRAMSNGEIWLLEYGGLEPGPAFWTVVGVGDKIHRVALPSRGEVLDARDGRALVRDTDADGVERFWIGSVGVPASE